MSNVKIGRMVLGVCQTSCYFIFKEGYTNKEGLVPVIFVDPADLLSGSRLRGYRKGSKG